MNDMEKILEALSTALVYVTDCANDPAFKPGVVRAQAYRIKEAIKIAEGLLEDGKPSWSNAPSWARYLAMNIDGQWNWFATKPVEFCEGWECAGQKQHAGYQPTNYWYDSLEARP